jgi:hypothetical protein
VYTKVTVKEVEVIAMEQIGATKIDSLTSTGYGSRGLYRRYIVIPVLLVFTLLQSACNEGILKDLGLVDSRITEEEASAENYDLKTPGFGIRVAIREDVNGDREGILTLLDERAADFLECQFTTSQVGTQDFRLESGDVVSSLSDLRVFVVPTDFECDAVDTDVCSGIFFPDSDLIVIAEEGIGRCGELPLWKHELGHRYGMALDHSNQGDFEPCIDPPSC